MIRLWPINGRSEEELRSEATRFIHQKLQVCTISCTNEQILNVRRTRQAKKSNISHELIVFFADKYARDQVVSNAKHLAEYRLPDGRPTAGMRMNYPDHLTKDFRVLEWYGAELNRRFPGTKRNIKFDDASEGLRMDVKVPHAPEWHRVYPDMAREIRQERTSDSASRTRVALETPPLTAPSLGDRPASRGLLTGGNSVLKAPILSTASLLTQLESTSAKTAPASSVQSPVVHDPEEIIYISPTRRTR